MKIDYEGMYCFANDIGKYIILLQHQIEQLEKIAFRLSENSGVDDVIMNLCKTKNMAEEHLSKFIQIKQAVAKISDVYMDGERKIEQNIEGDWKIQKSGFSSLTDITVNTSFQWSIE